MVIKIAVGAFLVIAVGFLIHAVTQQSSISIVVGSYFLFTVCVIEALFLMRS